LETEGRVIKLSSASFWRRGHFFDIVQIWWPSPVVVVVVGHLFDEIRPRKITGLDLINLGSPGPVPRSFQSSLGFSPSWNVH